MSSLRDLAAALGADQHGVFTRTQLRAAGISDRRERRALATGRWIAVVPEAYVIAGHPIGPWQRALAAVAVSGGDLSHESAASVHGIDLSITPV